MLRIGIVAIAIFYFAEFSRAGVPAQNQRGERRAERGIPQPDSPYDSIKAYEAVLRLDEGDRRVALRRIVSSDDMMFRASAASELFRLGHQEDAAFVVPWVAGWQPREQLELLQGLPLVGPTRAESVALAREILRGSVIPQNEAVHRRHPSALGAAAVFLAYHTANRSEVKLVENVIRRHPGHYGLWMALSLMGPSDELTELAKELAADDGRELEVRIAAGLTLGQDSPEHEWANKALREFIDRYKNVEYPPRSDAETTPNGSVREFAARKRVAGLIQVLCKEGQGDYTLELLAARNAVIRDVAGIVLVLHAPGKLLNDADLQLSGRDIQRLGVLVSVSRPDLRQTFEQKLIAIEDNPYYEQMVLNLGLFADAGGVVAGR